MNDADTQRYLSGTAIYGDDFSNDEIAAWHNDEADAYANLGALDQSRYANAYHALNAFHGKKRLPDRTYSRLLGFGAAYGDELLPWLARAECVYIVDPSMHFAQTEVHGRPATYVRPAPDGKLPLPDGDFDLITCLGVLHHIPNVTAVFQELVRVMAPGACMLLREPIVSMGDWRQPRRGLTKRERGIPLQPLRQLIAESGLSVLSETLCAFPLTTRLFRPLRPDVYNSKLAVRVDAWLSTLTAFNVNYHPRSNWERMRPTAAYFVLQKPCD